MSKILLSVLALIPLVMTSPAFAQIAELPEEPVIVRYSQSTIIDGQKFFQPHTDCYMRGYIDAIQNKAFDEKQRQCGYPDAAYTPGYVDGCAFGLLKTSKVCEAMAAPKPTTNLVQTQEPKLVCQSNDDFCEPGCEHADMQCIDGENDDNRNGVKDSEEEDDREKEDIKYCVGQQAPQYPDSCYDKKDVPDFPDCNDVEAGTRCDGSEDENSWTDDEEDN